MPKRITDLKRFAAKTPLVLKRPRASAERFSEELLLQRSTKSRQIAWDLAHKNKPIASEKIFVVEAPRPSPWPRVLLVSFTLLTILAVTFAGVFGEGKDKAASVLAEATRGVSDLESAGTAFAAGDFIAAADKFQGGLAAFQTAEQDIELLAGAGAVLATKPESIQSGAKLVSAGRLIASSGEQFSQAADKLRLAFATWSDRQKLIATGSSVTPFTDELNDVATLVLSGTNELSAAESLLQEVNPDALPAELSSRVIEARTKLATALEVAQPYLKILPQITDVLGARVSRRYLVLLQNPDEIRPTGGFIGSVALVEVSKGFLKFFALKDVYEIDGQLTRIIPPPDGYQILTDRWGLRDANTSPDFPTSAQQAELLFEEAGFGTVDGVFAVTSDLLTRIVRETGGVELARFGHVAPDDLTLLLSTVIEAKLDGDKAPKKILTELLEQLKKKAAELPTNKLLTLGRAAIAAKEFQAYFLHSEWAELPAIFHVDGALPKTDGDFIAIIDTSLSGNKSDRYTRNQVTHTSEITAAGSIKDTVRIVRTNSFGAADQKQIQKIAKRVGVTLDDKLLEILGAGRNVDYLKIYVPDGSQLVSVQGIAPERVEKKSDGDYTYFVLSLTTPPGESREVALTYTVPQILNYSFTADYQAGTHPTEFTKIVQFDGQEVLNKKIMLTERTKWSAKE